jgi:hypothetical protein
LGFNLKVQLKENHPYAYKSIDEWMKYLGFKLNTKSYSFDDWVWHIKHCLG